MSHGRSGSQELGHLKLVAFAGAWLFEKFRYRFHVGAVGWKRVQSYFIGYCARENPKTKHFKQLRNFESMSYFSFSFGGSCCGMMNIIQCPIQHV